MRKLLAVFTALSISLLTFMCVGALVAQEASTLLISQVKIGGDAVGGLPQEYVLIQNVSSHDISLDKFYLEYYKTPSGGTSSADCSMYPWINEGSNDHQLLLLSSDVLRSKESLVFEMAITDSRGGSLRIVEQKDESDPVQHDLVGWDSGDSAAGCYESEAVKIDSARVITRSLDYQGLLVDTDNNSQDFTAKLEPDIDACSNIDGVQPEIPPGYEQDPGTAECSEVIEAPDDSCEGLVINEVLPNPLGSDDGREFIEIYNTSTKAADLEGCSLKTSSSSKEYKLGGEPLGANEYRSYYDNETGLSLVNSSGGTVWLLSSLKDIDEVKYPGDMKDDVSYARFKSSWEMTYTVTPGKANVLTADLPCPSGQERSKETNRCRNTEAVDTLADCGPGRYRHPETNRCRNVAATASSLVPCSAGQYRSPETNRCRNTVSATSSLKPCASNQYRNPATNRCKKIETSASSLVPCKPGQERNPETNRCRKVSDVLAASAASPAQVSAASDKPLGFDYRVWTMLGAATLGYGAWEYRSELRQWTRSLRSKKPRIKPPG